MTTDVQPNPPAKPISPALKFGASVLVIGAAVAYLLQSSMSEQVEYYRPADEVVVNAAALKGQKMRMGGKVRAGTIFMKPGTLDYQFDVYPIEGMLKFKEAANKTVTVRYSGVVPDTFKDDAQVIVTGKLGEDGVFVANDLLAKCPSKYEAAEKNQGKY
ncbi:MAG: cytochrome c maturation protein CcmE [Myxococcota bacterium]